MKIWASSFQIIPIESGSWWLYWLVLKCSSTAFPEQDSFRASLSSLQPVGTMLLGAESQNTTGLSPHHAEVSWSQPFLHRECSEATFQNSRAHPSPFPSSRTAVLGGLYQDWLCLAPYLSPVFHSQDLHFFIHKMGYWIENVPRLFFSSDILRFY